MVLAWSAPRCEGGRSTASDASSARLEGAQRPTDASAVRDVRRSGASGDRLRSEAERAFARAHHLDSVLGDLAAAQALYRQLTHVGRDDLRVKALAYLRLAELCRLRGDRRRAMKDLDWLINRSEMHPDLARRAERLMVRLLHPQVGKMSALTRGPPVGFTALAAVPASVARRFQRAEQALVRYVRVRLSFRMHNLDAVRELKQLRLAVALKAYEALGRSSLPNVKAAALFRLGSLHQDYAEALVRVRVPEEFLPREAAKLRARLHVESVAHFRRALARYKQVRQVSDVSAERWRRAARQLQEQLVRLLRRRLGPGGIR